MAFSIAWSLLRLSYQLQIRILLITLHILDQKQAKHHFGKANYWFSFSNHERGGSRLIPLSYFTSQY
ncbi:hypothetical protein HN51_028261 [Arachis hypogaea]